MTYRAKKTLYRRQHRLSTDIYGRNPKYSLIIVNTKINQLSSGNSPRVNGKLQLRQNTLTSFWSNSNTPSGEYTYAAKSAFDLYGDFRPGYGPFRGPYALSAAITVPPADTAGALYDAASRFYLKVSNAKVSLAQAFAERQQTVDLIASTARRLANFYRSFRRGRNPFTGLRCNSKDAANLWLEYSYGWVPLVSDVHDILTLKDHEPPPFIVTSRSKIKQNLFQRSVSPSSYVVRNEAYTTEIISTVTIRAAVVVSDPSAAFGNNLGLANPAQLAWELLPYSFVVDWFIPIGDWLESQSALLGLTLSDKSTTTTVSRYTYAKGQMTPGISSSWASGSSSASYFSKSKIRTLSIPTVPLPRLKNPVSTSHAISALALLRQAFK